MEDYSGAKKTLALLLETHPEFVPAITMMSYLEYFDGNFEISLELVNKALDLDPTYDAAIDLKKTINDHISKR